MLTLCCITFVSYIIEVQSASIKAPSQWRPLDSTGKPLGEWQTGDFANLGFTDQQIQMRVQLPNDKNKADFISVSPTYLDRVVVEFSHSGNHLEQQIKGDKVAYNNPLPDVQQDFSQFSFAIPADADAALITAASTSNLRLHLGLHEATSMQAMMYKNWLFKVVIFTLFAIASLIGIVATIYSRNSLYALFTVYSSCWLVLLSSISNALVTFDANFNVFNDRLTSYGAILCSLTGSAFYTLLLYRLSPRAWYQWPVRITTLLSCINLIIYMFIDERLGLKSNILALTLLSPSVLLMAIVAKGKTPESQQTIDFIRWPVIIGVAFLGVSTLSGLGVGATFSMTYMQALFNLLVTAMIIISWNYYRQQQTNQLHLANLVLESENQRTAQQLEEQNTLVAMLSHEIKTPLTTIRFKLHNRKEQELINPQLKQIEHVVNQTDLMNYLNNVNESSETVHCAKLIQTCWQSTFEETQDKQLQQRQYGRDKVTTNHYHLQTISNNLLSNAIKYGASEHIYCSVKSTQHTVQIRIANKIAPELNLDTNTMTEKHWRSPLHTGQRGTGLGLWIVQQLCQQQGYKLHLQQRRDCFIASVSIPYE